MKSYCLYIDDDRYSVPTLLFIMAGDDAEAQRVADGKLSEPHHLAVEVREVERELCRLVSPVTTP